MIAEYIACDNPTRSETVKLEKLFSRILPNFSPPNPSWYHVKKFSKKFSVRQS